MNNKIVCRIIILIPLVILPLIIKSQCDTGSEPECQCETAVVLCSINELDGFVFRMSEYQHPLDGPNPMCNGDEEPDNPTWFAFVAWCTEMEITLGISNCTVIPTGPSTSTFGTQVAVYEDCTSFVEVDCVVNDCNNEDDKVLMLANLQIGHVYYLMIDGCMGSACDVEIDVVGSCDETISDWTDETIYGELNLNLGDSEVYTVEELTEVTSYHWFIDGTEIEETTEPFNSITWDMEGIFELCVDVSNVCIPIDDDPLQICEIVTVFNGTLVYFSSSSYSGIEGNSQFDICLSIENEDQNNDTVCEITLSNSGSATNFEDFNHINNTQLVEFPAGSNTDQCFTITIIDDNDIEANETIIFNLTSVFGGDNATIDSPSTTTFTIIDNDDVDNDGISNNLDNCVANYNPDQEDIDGDGIGDVCDSSNIVSYIAELEDNIYLNKSQSGLIVISPDGNCWIMTVANDGEVIALEVECP